MWSDEIRRLYVEHAADIHRYATRRVGRDLADDVVADTFRHALESRDSYDPERGGERGWLFGIATNLLRRHWRTERRRLTALDRHARDRHARDDATTASDDPLAAVPARLDGSDEVGRVLSAVERLDASDRDLLVLVAWEEMSSDKVAEILGIPAGTVRSRLHRIRRRLDAERRPAAGTTPLPTRPDQARPDQKGDPG